MARPVIDRLIDRVEIGHSGGCWLWTGIRQPNGYGRIRSDGRRVFTHRVMYEWFNGPIPDGLTIDHLCRVRHCLNPDHLEAVTHRTNILRGESLSAVNARKTHCKRGHEFTDENTMRSVSGARICRICSLARNREARRAANGGILLTPHGERTHCPQGHEYVEANTYRDRNGGRACRICRRAHARSAYRRKREREARS